jgi:hypothetical protein
MQIVSELEKQYFEIENQYLRNEFLATSTGNHKQGNYWLKKREINAHAYFLFLFTRLEDRIVNQSNKLIKKKKGKIKHWKTRACWDIIDPKKLNFESRIALLTEKGNKDYNLIIEFYKKRNTIAHGGNIPNITVTIYMNNIFKEIDRLYRIL